MDEVALPVFCQCGFNRVECVNAHYKKHTMSYDADTMNVLVHSQNVNITISPQTKLTINGTQVDVMEILSSLEKIPHMVKRIVDLEAKLRNLYLLTGGC